MTKKKIIGISIIVAAYVVAFLAGFLSFYLIEKFAPNVHEIFNLLIADVVATIVIWIIGMIFKSASVYDPYWSVQTFIIMLCLLIKYNNFNLGNILLLVVIGIYTLRLTANFFVGFNDISYIDWRYKKIKEKCGKFYQIVSLIGIHLIPTGVVFAASIPAFTFIRADREFSLFNLIGLAIILLGIVLEFIADMDMKKFQKTRTSRSEIIRVGLWKHSRHPNYLGEILIWYGVALVFVLPNFLSSWYYLTGAILNTLLFIFISVPLADNNLKTYKDNYLEYRKETRCFLPFPRFKRKK